MNSTAPQSEPIRKKLVDLLKLFEIGELLH
jgi:hypothetical protein